jgi:hypothetical protein
MKSAEDFERFIEKFNNELQTSIEASARAIGISFIACLTQINL